MSSLSLKQFGWASVLVMACAVDQRGPGVVGDSDEVGIEAANPQGGMDPETAEGIRGGDGAAGEGAPSLAGLSGTDVAAAMGACTPGNTSCSSTTEFFECNAGGSWVGPTACEFACVGTSCGGECIPGSSECVATTLVRTCSADGVWSEPAECENACAASACGGECRPGLTRCTSGTEVQRCGDDGLWGGVSACENACVGASCTGECVPGTSECFSPRELRSCGDSGQWQVPTTCTNACVDEACGGACVPGTRRCQPSSDVAEFCSDDGAWVDETACPFVCVGSGTCAGECVPGTRRCNPVSGTPQLCSSTGGWQNQSRCQFQCSGAGECAGECVPGTFRCSSAQLERCVDFEWQFEDQCLTAAHCNASRGVCVGSDCADDADPNSQVVSDPVFGCGLSWDLAEDPGGDWVEFASGLHFDTDTGTAWIHPSEGSYDLAALQAMCADFEFEGITGWIVPTIDDTRELAFGCAPTDPGGSCRVSDPGCISQAVCGSCDSCLGGTRSSGRSEDDQYCRPNARICDNLRTSSACTDCAIASTWEYGITNGNIDPRDITHRTSGVYCIRRNFPL
jgi:hypothetical protein